MISFAAVAIPVRAPGTAAEPYAPKPGRLAHPSLPSTGSTPRAGKSHALAPRQHIIARLTYPRPPSSATTRHGNFHSGSDIAPSTTSAPPHGARSVYGQSHATKPRPLRRSLHRHESLAVTHIVHAFTVRLSSHHVLTRPSVRSRSLNSNQLALHSRRLDLVARHTDQNHLFIQQSKIF